MSYSIACCHRHRTFLLHYSESTDDDREHIFNYTDLESAERGWREFVKRQAKAALAMIRNGWLKREFVAQFRLAIPVVSFGILHALFAAQLVQRVHH